MKTEWTKKAKITALVIVYLIARLYQSWEAFFTSDVFADIKKVDTNIVAVLVDKELYSNTNFKNALERYTTQYIQQKISNSKAVVFPLDTTIVKSRDIAKLLENLYYDGIEKEPSTLEGVILVGDKIPLPVVNDNGAIFPTVLPYTDFDDPKFYRDPMTQYFIPNGVAKAQPEVRHSIINLEGNVSDYVVYFQKLKSYNNNPNGYIGDRIWYEDFIDQKESYNDLNLVSYMNKFLFAEDLAYHRFSPLLIDFFNNKENKKTNELVWSLASLTGESGSYAEHVGGVFSGLMAEYTATQTASSEQVPTVFVDDALEGFQKWYSDLYGVTSTARMRDNILSAGRRNTTEIDNHNNKIEYFDQLYTKQLGESAVPLLAEINKQFEDTLIKAVKNNDYALHVAIPEKATIKKNNVTMTWGTDMQANLLDLVDGLDGDYYTAGIYEAFYYGRNASTITWLDQTSIFLGTPNPLWYNIDNLALMTGHNSSGSLGVSQGILSEFVEANRGYVVSLWLSDKQFKQDFGICGSDDEGMQNFEDYVQMYLWGNTPLNLGAGDNGLELNNKSYDRGGKSNWVVQNASLFGMTPQQINQLSGAGQIFNIAGSRRVYNLSGFMFAQNLQGWFLQRVAFQMIVPNLLRRKLQWTPVHPCDPVFHDAEPLQHHNIYSPSNLIDTGYQKTLTLWGTSLMSLAIPCPVNPTTGSDCFPYADKPKVPSNQYIQQQLVNYKIIDSTSIHNSPNPEQVSQFDVTTPSRPIDSVRYITFQGIGGDRVQLPFPNLYAVEVYKQDSEHANTLILKTKEEIKTTIREYLTQIVDSYNTFLTEQNTKKTNYYNSNATLFNKLWTVDSFATPNRSYTLLQSTLFSSMISDDMIDAVASLLYVENSLIPSKQKTTNVAEEYEQFYTLANITNKKQTLLQEYLTEQTPSSLLTLPWYQDKGYELISLTSDGDDSINSQNNTPSRLVSLQKQLNDYQNYQNMFNTRDTSNSDTTVSSSTDSCTASYGEPVPLVKLSDMSFPWFDAFACWLEHIGVPKVTFDFKNAQGPVFIPWALKDFVSGQSSLDSYQFNTIPAPSLTASEQELVNSLDLSLSTQSYALEDNVPLDLRPTLLLTQKNDIKPLQLRITSTGDTCVMINTTNTCTTPFQKIITDKNYISPYIVPVQPKAWVSTLIIQICQWLICATQTLPYFITPGPLTQASIFLPYDKLLSQSQIPVIVEWKDKHNNRLTTVLSPVTLSTDQGNFVGGSTWYTYSNLRDYVQLNVPKVEDKQDINLNLYNKDTTLLANKKLSVYSGSIAVVSSNNYYTPSTTSITYTLPNKKSQLFLADNHINIGLLPQLSLKLQSSHGDMLAWPVLVQSEQGLFSIYEKTLSDNTSIIPSTGLQLTNTLIFDGTKTISLVLQPKLNKNIGSDVLVFLFPDGSEQRIPVVIKSAEQATQIVLEANTTKKLLDNSVSVPIVLQLFDDWGNRSPYSQNIQLDSFGSLSIQWPSLLSVVGGIAQFILKTDNLWGPWYIRATWVGSWNLIPWFWSTQVKKSIIPTANINGLYLNIVGASRWNTTDTTADYFDMIPKILKTSKVLATTTELIAPEDVPTTVISISSQGELWGGEADQWIVTTSWSHVLAQNPWERKQVTLGMMTDRSWTSQLVQATESYPEDFTLYPKNIWGNGSTNSTPILYLVDSTVSYDPNKNTSVEEATITASNIWRRHNQQHLTQWGQWKSVWEATLLNASEFLVNYGDPLISRKDKNAVIAGANVDAWPGQLIVSDTTKTIKKAFALDVNNDGLEDIVTVFTDGSVIWSKQYGWKDSIYVEMWPLLQIYGSIKDVFGGDTQWDGFGDIIVQTEQDDLRVYTNVLGIFNVDGYPVCLDQDQEDGLPQRMSNVDQRFLEDMDNDGVVDIVLNKSGEISIVYGWKSGNGYSYISQDTMRCDPNWQSRQKNHVKIVDNIGVQLQSWATVDTSLIRWKWLTLTESLDGSGNVEDTTTSNPYIATQIGQAFTGNFSTWLNIGQFPIDEIVSQASANLMKRSVSPVDFMPSYETLALDDIRYISASQLQNSDQVRVYKTYENLSWWVLKKWNIVKVKVKITWPRNDAMTYIDRIQWPWNIVMSGNVISWWNPWSLPSTATYNSISPQGDFYFIVDNITLWSTDTVEFSYNLVFQWGAPIKIAVSDRNHDDYQDISVYPIDSCSKFLRTYTNTKSLLQSYRSYEKEFIDVGQKLEDYYNTTQTNTQNYLSWMTNSIQNIASWWSAQDIFNNIWGETMSFGNFFNQVVGQWGYNSFNLNVTLMGNFDTQVGQSIKETLDNICSWWTSQDQSCSSGLPVPFNMSFLSPGTFNIMGCTPKSPKIKDIFPEDNGFPIFAFPATLQAWPVALPLPFPWWGIQQWATDNYWYYWFPSDGWVYPSMIRIYLSPTLTQQMGIAICFGPQKVGNSIPSPFNAIAWNCIVTAVKTPSWSCDIDDPNSNNGNNGLSDQDILDLAQFGQCTQTTSNGWSTPATSTPTSPFTMVTVNSNGTTSNPFPSGTYFGVINFEKTPIVLSEGEVDGWVVLQWGKAVSPQIQWWWAKGLVACIVNDWLDRQTNYIINNFTNMQIGIYLPDLTQLWKGFDTLWSQISTQEEQIPNSPDIANNINTFSGNLISQVRNSTIKQSEINNLSTTLNNPFKEIEKLFEQTPLININTQDVVVNVPMIYSEDITRYEAHLKSWIERNKQTAADRQSLIQGVLGVCSQQAGIWSWNPADPNIINSIKTWIQTKKTELTNDRTLAQQCQQQNREWSQCTSLSIKYDGVSPQNDKVLLDVLDSKLSIMDWCFEIVGGSLSASLSSIISITSQSEAFENRVRENIKVLDQYKRFPLQLYQWIHVTDRYLWEIASMVENFLGYINTWLNMNATRFEQYVDAIITISTALETWQAILDLSVDRQKKCSTCTVDSYDAYACSLGFLCGELKLPILKLPPFKIPNIYIDLSHIDLGMDILLPNFQFVPTSVPLIEIPDLPQPPNIVVDWNIAWWALDISKIQDIQKILDQFSQLFATQIPLSVPTIPLLPSPPTLPELPSFIPNINVELPVLPPAPKLPRIAPEIETVINVVSFFSDLYCIVKWGIGLVGEKNVKTRIEQLTQRTREIPLFDNINLTKDMSYQQDKLEWFDFQIDAFLNFTMNFTGVYDLIKQIADMINTQTKKLTDWNPNESIGTNKLQEYVNDVNSTTQQNIDLANPFGYVEDKNLVALAQEQNTIKEITNYMSNLSQTPPDKKEVLHNLVARIETQSSFKPQTEQINTLQQQVVGSLTESRTQLQNLSYKVENYDTFLDSLNQQTSYSLYNGSGVYGAELLENEKNVELPKESLMNDYIALQRKLLSNYDKWLYQVQNSSNQNDVKNIRTEIAYLDKWLSLVNGLYRDDTSSIHQLSTLQREYNALDNLQYNNQAAVCSTLGDITSSTATLADSMLNLYPSTMMTAQVGGWGSTSSSTSSFSSNLYDFTSYNNKVMIPYPQGTGTRYIDVIQSDYFSNRNQWYQVTELNDDHEKDVIHRDQSQVWIKYGQQNTSHISPTLHTTTTKYYVAPLWDEENEREERSDKNGYLTVNGTSFKIYAPDWSVKNLRVRSQDYDSFTISWTNSARQQSVDGYLLEINMIPDLYHLKVHNDIPKNLQSRYVLLVPDMTDIDDAYLAIHNQLNSKKIKNLVPDTVIDIVPYNVDAGQVSYTFTDLERAWYYTRITSLASNGSKNPIYMPSSPWSHHVVAGQQLIADTDGPTPEVRLVREKTNGLIDTWLQPQGIVNTMYRLEVTRDDPSGVLDNWITTASGDVLSTQSGATNTLSDLYFVSNQNIQYRIGAKDSSNNKSTETVLLTITVPTIQIDDIIQDNMIPWWLNILSSLSKGMDDGIVKFERKRNNIWTTLSNPMLSWSTPNTFLYPLWFDQTLVTGGVYNQSQGIEFFASDGSTIATMNNEDGQITIMPKYSDTVQIKPDISSQVPAIILYDMIQHTNLFIIKPKTIQSSLQAIYPYSIQALTWSQYGSFAWWSCIMNTSNECVVVMNTVGDIVIPSPYHTSQKATTYHFSDGMTSMGIATSVGTQVGILHFTATLP